jgi:hypothetical protein
VLSSSVDSVSHPRTAADRARAAASRPANDARRSARYRAAPRAGRGGSTRASARGSDQRAQPLQLAQTRLRGLVLEFGRAFNAMAERLGTSVTSVAMAPWRVARSAVDYVLQVHAREPLPLRQRQALAHWKTFVAQHPDAEESESLEPRIRSAEWRLRHTQRNRELRDAERALDEQHFALALVHADRAARART